MQHLHVHRIEEKIGIPYPPVANYQRLQPCQVAPMQGLIRRLPKQPTRDTFGTRRLPCDGVNHFWYASRMNHGTDDF